MLAGKLEDGLVWIGARVAAEPDDAAALLVTGRCLGGLGRDQTAARSLVAAVDVALDTGNLPVAVAACRELRDLGEDPSLQYERLARTFARGSDLLLPRGHEPPSMIPGVVEPFPRESAIEQTERAVRRAVEARAQRRADGKRCGVQSQVLFSSLEYAGLRAIVEVFDVIYVDSGTVLIEQGTIGAEAFVVVRGELQVSRSRRTGDTVLARLGAGALFGEMALLSRAPRAARVVALRPSIILVAGQAALDAVAERQPQVGVEIAAHCRGRMVSNLVRTSAVFSAIDAADRLAVMVRFVTRTYETGQRLITQAEETDGLHLIASGEVEVLHRDGDDTTHLADLGVGEVVGEMGLVLRRPAGADVVAKVPTVTLHLPRDGFLDLVKEHPAVLTELYDLAVRRDQETTSILSDDAAPTDDCIIV